MKAMIWSEHTETAVSYQPRLARTQVITLRQSSYPRSNGSFLSLPQRQTIVLLTERTIRELRSSTTPTSQFSSLHFIASTAMGARGIESGARTRKRGGQRWAAVSGTSAGRAAAAAWGARARVLAQTAGQPALSHGRRGRHDGDYLTVRGAIVTPRALGLHTTHLSRYLIAMLRGLDLASRLDEALSNYVVQVKS